MYLSMVIRCTLERDAAISVYSCFKLRWKRLLAVIGSDIDELHQCQCVLAGRATISPKHFCDNGGQWRRQCGPEADYERISNRSLESMCTRHYVTTGTCMYDCASTKTTKTWRWHTKTSEKRENQMLQLEHNMVKLEGRNTTYGM